jgi:two-component system cell cycle sensor histidine kinase/response regulator CckA
VRAEVAACREDPKGPDGMKSSIRILQLEDNALDAALIKETLAAGEIDFRAECVDNRADFIAASERGGYDLILADYTLPSFDGLTALSIAREKCPEIPFIFVSGSLGEEVAIESLKSGATDYVLKHRLARLVPSVKRALDEVDQRAARQRAERQVQFQASLLDQVPNGIIAIDADGTIIQWNKFAVTLFQWKAEDVVGRGIKAVGVLPESPLQESETANWLQNGYWEGELELRKRDGTTFSAYVIETAIRVGQVGRGFVVLASDITYRKQLEDQLRQSQKMEAIGSLAGGVAHDFNNLLTAIIGYSQLAMGRLGYKERARADIAEIEKAAKRAAALTNQLLAFSRRQVLQPTVLDLNEVVMEVEKMLQRLIGEDIMLTTNLNTELGLVKADPGQIEQVIMNLVINARDSMPKGGKLTIETNNFVINRPYASRHGDVEPGPYVMLAVIDTGFGMDQETQARIFEPFFTTKQQGEGTGLGLSTVFGIVRQSGGHIWVYSEPGDGTTFKIYLPRIEDGASSVDEIREPVVESIHGAETILLVEDEEVVRTLARQVLEINGYTVLEAESAADALILFEKHEGQIHLMVTDVVMPGKSGRELAERLVPSQPGMKVLYMSGYTDDAIVHHGVLDAGTSFLQKPFTPDALARKVREVLDKPAGE